MYSYTIIIPHKNIPNLLQRCLDSIPHRDDIQIIIVDDNSDKNLVDFLSFPGLGEKNIEVYFTKEGKGAGYARNIGLSHAQGDWILFADADDYYHTENLNILLNLAHNTIYQVIFFFCEYITLGNAHSVETYNIQHRLQTIENYKDIESILYKFTMAPWRKMIRADHIVNNNLHFEEVMASNDCKFAMLLGSVTKSVGIFTDIVYTYEERPNSLVRMESKEYLICKMEVGIQMNRHLKKIHLIQYKDTTDEYLLGLKKKSFFLFVYYLFKEWILVDFKTMCIDLKYIFSKS